MTAPSPSAAPMLPEVEHEIARLVRVLHIPDAEFSLLRDALRRHAEEAARGAGEAFPGFVLVGEAPKRSAGKWSVPELNANWVPNDFAADRDPANTHPGGRFCVFLNVGAVEPRETDRIVLLRRAPASTKREP